MPLTRRAFLAGVAALLVPAAYRPRWRRIPAGYSGGYGSGYATRRQRIR